MDGYQKRTKQKRDKIIAAAQELFFKYGMTTTGVADIAKLAGVSQVTIYNYFGSKENLLRAVMEQFASQGVEACEKVLTENVPFEEKMERVFELQRSLAALMTQEFLKSVVWSDPANQNVSREIFQKKTLPFLQRFLDQGKQEGIINPSITWEALMAYTTALASIKLQPDYLKSSKEHKQAIDRLFYYGLIGK